MFIIIGGDGKEYGPVTTEQLRAWLAGGRANLDTKAKAVGTETWQRLGDFAEFSGAGLPVPAPPPAGAIDPKAYADDLIARAAQLDIGHALSRSWELLKSDFWPIVGVSAVVIIAAAAAGSIPILGILVSLLLTGVFYGGLYSFYLKKIRGHPAEIGDAFSGFSLALVPLMITTFLVTLLTMVGMVCLILPGIYLAVAYSFSYLLVIDRKLEFWAAMEVSRRVITAQWWRMFGLMFLGALIAALGVVGLLIGIFITVPIFIGAVVYAYEDLCNPPPRL
jgi:uncharacterized membrane protein